jgi:hypothetical protein
MSHFSRVKSRMVEERFLTAALEDLGYEWERGDLQVQDFGGNRTAVGIRVRTKHPRYDIGFRKAGDAYEIVADWWGVGDIDKDRFRDALYQRYAYHAARATLEAEQGFSVVTETVDAEGRIRLVLRRMV